MSDKHIFRIKHVRQTTGPNTYRYFSKITNQVTGKVIDLSNRYAVTKTMALNQPYVNSFFNNSTTIMRRVLNVMEDDFAFSPRVSRDLTLSGMHFWRTYFTGRDTVTSDPFFETTRWDTEFIGSISFNVAFGAARLVKVGGAAVGNKVYNNFQNGSYKLNGWVYGGESVWGYQTVTIAPHETNPNKMWVTVSGTANDRTLQMYNRSKTSLDIKTFRLSLYPSYQYTDINVRRKNGGKGIEFRLATYCALSKTGEQAWTCWTKEMTMTVNDTQYW